MQAPSTVVIVRPHFFTPNKATAADNEFQSVATEPEFTVFQKAFDEVTNVIEALTLAGVKVHAFDDRGIETPDSVFPNNWFSTHDCGTLVLYPMYCENRRQEINPAILTKLANEFAVTRCIDYSEQVKQQQFLEGTGAMVLDHDNRIAYAVRSKRMNEKLLREFCSELDFTPCIFDAHNDNGTAIYHTNVLMCVTKDFVMIGLDMIKDAKQRARVINTINTSGKQIIELTTAQIEHFAGNALELTTPNRNVLAISQTAINTLNDEQKFSIEQYLDILPVKIPTIELAGGSIRCMLAGIHFKPKPSTNLQ